jgi:hypothetical protein
MHAFFSLSSLKLRLHNPSLSVLHHPVHPTQAGRTFPPMRRIHSSYLRPKLKITLVRSAAGPLTTTVRRGYERSPKTIQSLQRTSKITGVGVTKRCGLHPFLKDRELTQDYYGIGMRVQPDMAQQTLMARTAAHLFSSPNSAQLELRILANHGANPRFAFLRGRWAHAWTKAKLNANAEKTARERKDTTGERTNSAAVLSGLLTYGESDSESEHEHKEDDLMVAEDSANEAARPMDPPSVDVGEAAQAARRARAKEWAAKRRAAVLEKPS